MTRQRTYHTLRGGNDMTLSNYYSNTYDVLVVDESEGEESAKCVVIASFADSENAQAFKDERQRYVIGIRPPSSVVRDGLAWAHLVASECIEALGS